MSVGSSVRWEGLYAPTLRMEYSPQEPGYAALRRFRRSTLGAEYFLTANLMDRGRGLETPELTGQLFREWQSLEREGLWSVRTAVVMPDHLHLLVCLGASVSLVECMRLFKGRLAPSLRRHAIGWQKGFYDHQVRSAEDPLPTFLYIYLNRIAQTWSGQRCHGLAIYAIGTTGSDLAL